MLYQRFLKLFSFFLICFLFAFLIVFGHSFRSLWCSSLWSSLLIPSSVVLFLVTVFFTGRWILLTLHHLGTPRSGRSPGVENGNPLQYSCLENMDRGAWRATVHGVTRSWTWQSMSTHKHFIFQLWLALFIFSSSMLKFCLSILFLSQSASLLIMPWSFQ